jgi:uncharacterized protein YdeI (YjbR/CyaY-like superfamily)
MLRAAVCLLGQIPVSNRFLILLTGFISRSSLYLLFFMNAIVIDLKDFTIRTPEQVFRVFFKLYDAAKVKAELWHHFGTWAAALEKQATIPDEKQAQVALLFDQLIALTEALENLKNGNTNAISCVVCGGKRKNKTGEEPTGQA